MLGGIVRGKLVTLRVPREDDLGAYQRWSSDLRVRRGGTRHAYWGEPALPAAWKERLAKQSEDKESVLWSIEAGAACVGLCRVQYQNLPAADGVDVEQFTIDPEHWRRGYGWDAALTLHRWVFDIVHLRTAAAAMPTDNVAGARICEKLGYAEFARGHRVYYKDGAYVDQTMLRMDLETWDERWGATEREYAPLGEELER